jgi:hypothetical protein
LFGKDKKKVKGESQKSKLFRPESYALAEMIRTPERAELLIFAF